MLIFLLSFILHLSRAMQLFVEAVTLTFWSLLTKLLKYFQNEFSLGNNEGKSEAIILPQ